MGWDAGDERRVIRALAQERDALMLIGREPSGGDIVFDTLCSAIDIERRQKVRGGGPRELKAMKIDYTREPEEHAEDFKQRMIEIAAGDSPDEVFGIYTQPSPAEIDTMESVKVVFRSCLVGKCQDRDWKILYLLAMPKATTYKVGRIIGRKRELVADRKKLQCDAIWVKLKSLLPATELETGVVFKVAA